MNTTISATLSPSTRLAAPAAGSKRLPAALWALTISAYGIGTTEFVIVGLLPTVAKDLQVSIPSAGLLVSFYAIGVAIGAPVLTALTSRLPRRPLLIGLMLLFIAGNILAALSPAFLPLILARIVTGFAHGVFFSVGATIAAALVPAHKRASAIAIMFAGLTIAIVTGVPLGTFIGQHFGWKATFWGVAILGAIGLITNYFLLPRQIAGEATGTLREQLKVFRNKTLVLAFLTTILNYGGVFLVFTYLAPLLTTLTGIPEKMVSVILLIYGIAIAAGNISGGKLANRQPLKVLQYLLVIQVIVLGAFTFTVHHSIAAVITLFIMGGLSFATVPASQLYVVQSAEKQLPAGVNVASALNIASFNAGAAIGAYAGGLIVAAPAGLAATPWAGSLFVAGALLLTFISARRDRH